jgi:hypothetical protein
VDVYRDLWVSITDSLQVQKVISRAVDATI